jgi:outer membrane protein TolC
VFWTAFPPVLQVSGEPDVSLRPSLDMYGAGFDAIRGLELWGKRRRLSEGARAALEAAYADYDDVLVSLAGEVAATYFQIRTLGHQLKVTRESVALQKKFESIAQEGFKAGRNPETDAELAAALRGATDLAIPKFEEDLEKAENALCALLGKAPCDLRNELGTDGAIPAVPERIAAGVPADLLRRRPGVRLAERTAHAQCARIGFRKASILPSFNLIGAIGLQSTDSDRFFRRDGVRGAYGGLVNVTNLICHPGDDRNGPRRGRPV